MTRRLWLLVLCFVLTTPAGAWAQRDKRGAADHPMVPRLPGYYIEDYDAQDFGSYEFPLKEGEKKVEGRLWRIDYYLKKGSKALGPLQISRNYENAFADKGGQKIIEDMGRDGGRTTLRLPAGGGRFLWMEVSVSDRGETYQLNIVEEAGLQQMVELTAADLAKTLADKGSASIYGILFDTGKATIKPESEKTLATIAEVLTKARGLTLEIQGHTDNVGSKATNRKLSTDRAAAVKSYLVQKHGIAADRLTTAGFADDDPVADNASEAGRAKNRRVELVRK
jgi:outer membrane protein OmpA-like peptidoglycan-associated protein